MDVSVIICAYNRADFIIQTLSSLTDQTYDKKLYEIVIVDNNCTDNTEEVCRDYIAKTTGVSFQYVIESQQGLSFARNKGISVANGNIISFIDDDAFSDRHFIENIVRNFNSYPEYSALGGKVIPVYPDRKEPEWMSKYIEGLVSKIDYGDETNEFTTAKFPVGCNMSFRKEIFDLLGRFNVDITFRSDEKYMFLKLRENNKKILYTPDVIVYHHIEEHRLTPKGIKKTSLIIGSSERERLKRKSFLDIFKKLIEYIFKLFASFILGFFYLLQGKPLKAKYIIKVRLYVMIGFFNF